TAGPLTAAITGLVDRWMRSTTCPPRSAGARWSPSPTIPHDDGPPPGPEAPSEGRAAARSPNEPRSKVVAPAERSAPAQKARPAPVTTTPRTSSSASVRSNTSISSAAMRGVKAFSWSGRDSVTTAAGPRTSYVICSYSTSSPCRPGTPARDGEPDPTGTARSLGRVSTDTDPTATDPDANGDLDPELVDLRAADVAWDLESLVAGTSVDELLDRSEALTEELEGLRGRVAGLTAEELAAAMRTTAELQEAQGRAGYYAMLRFSEDTSDPERGALMMKVQERSTSLATRLVFFELEWAELDDARAEELLADPRLDFCAHHLRSVRRYRDHLLSEPEETLLTEKSVSGASAWVRLFDELTSAIEVELPASILESEEGGDTTTVGLEQALSMLQHPDRDVRRTAAEAVTAALEPGLRTRAFVFNTLLLDKS